MAVYTVHVPASARGEAVFVPDVFSRAAFVLGPFWFAWRRVWRGLVLWLIALGALAAVARAASLPPDAVRFAVLALAALTGLEANNLRRAALERRGWACVDVASGATLEDAERSYFLRAAAPATRAGAGPAPRAAPAAPVYDDVGGLFPGAGT